jgi:hypothetical protein
MIVQVELKTLLGKLAEFNPESDLTSVKAYLLDLALGNPVNEITVPARPAPTGQTPRPPFQPSGAVPRAMEGVPPVADASEGFDMDEEDSNDGIALENVIGTAPKPSAIKKVVSGKSVSSKEEREARRERARQFTEMSSQQILESLTAKNELKQRGGNKQIINEGFDDAGAGGDIEIG